MYQPPNNQQPNQPPPPFQQQPAPGQFYSPPPYPQPAPPKKKGKAKMWLWIIGGIFVLGLLGNTLQTLGLIPKDSPTSVPTQAAATQPVQAAQPTKGPTKEVSHYPPKNKDDLLALAAKGNAKNIHELSYQKAGQAAICPIPRVTVTVDRSLTGQALAQDLLAYFFGNHLDSPCSAIVFALHDKSETGFFSAGRIKLDVTTASGDINTDPIASGLKYELTLNVGKFGEGQEYVVTY